MRKLSKSIDEYLQAAGWSSNLFLNHAIALFSDKDILDFVSFEVGRTVVYIRSKDKLLKAYVHYNGRSKEFLTLVQDNGKELCTFYHSVSISEIKQKILEYFNSENLPN